MNGIGQREHLHSVAFELNKIKLLRNQNRVWMKVVDMMMHTPMALISLTSYLNLNSTELMDESSNLML